MTPSPSTSTDTKVVSAWALPSASAVAALELSETTETRREAGLQLSLGQRGVVSNGSLALSGGLFSGGLGDLGGRSGIVSAVPVLDNDCGLTAAGHEAEAKYRGKDDRKKFLHFLTFQRMVLYLFAPRSGAETAVLCLT